MENFVFDNPTRIVFGRGAENEVGREDRGMQPQGAAALRRRQHQEDRALRPGGRLAAGRRRRLRGAGRRRAQPAPLPGAREGIALCRENGLDLMLAVGGGSVIDSAKAIAMGVPYDGDVWDFYTGKADPQEALPVATVLTIPAAGSEASTGSVITNEDGLAQAGAATPTCICPRFCDPEPRADLHPAARTRSPAAPPTSWRTSWSATSPTLPHVDFTDRLCEATLKTIIDNVPLVARQPGRLRRPGRDHVGGHHGAQRPARHRAASATGPRT